MKINGEVADIYSPTTTSPTSMLLTVQDKVATQAPNVVINLADSVVSVKQLQDALIQNPISGLKKLYIIKEGKITLIEEKK